MSISASIAIGSVVMFTAHLLYGFINLYWFIFNGDTLFHPSGDQVGAIVISACIWMIVGFIAALVWSEA